MDLKRIADRAKELVDKRGGTDSLKQDAAELKDIAGGQGSVTDKAKEAFEAIKDPGADEAGQEVGEGVQEAASEPPPDRGDEPERGGRGEGRRGGGKRRGGRRRSRGRRV
ncbi:MAG: hypothetical protein ACRDK9_15250, partial [Solirubrobacterales bacterium]